MMPQMKDAQTGVVREVSEAWLKRFPGDYVKVSAKKAGKAATAGKKAGGDVKGTEK